MRTAAKVKEMLEAAGVTSVRIMGGTGLVIDIVGEAPAMGEGKRAVALRADLDALPMTEENAGLEYRSKNTGVAHMCGHDGHIACLVGAGLLFAKARSRIPSNLSIRLLFQPAEEGPGGAEPMIKEGCLEGIDEVYAMHNWPTLPLGTLGVVPGPMTSHTTEFHAVVRGQGGHASSPHLCIDPVVPAAHIVVGAQSIVSRNVSSMDSAVLSVTVIKGGEADNVIPEAVSMAGTIRDFKPAVSDRVRERFSSIIKHTAEAYNCCGSIRYDDGYPVTVNTPEETEHVKRVAAALLGEDNVTTNSLPLMASEDFAYYLQERPGCLFVLGTAEEGKESHLCHSSKFNFNDKLIPIAVSFWVRLVEDRLGASIYA